MADNITGFQVGADINPFEQSMRRMVEAARSGQSGVSGAFAGLEGIRNLMLGIGAAFGAIKMVDFVNSTLEAAGSLKDLSQKTGMTVESLSGMGSVAKLSGTAIDTVAAASNKLSFALAGTTEESKGAASALQALGINFKTFSALSPDDRLLAVAKAMGEFKDGASKTAAAMALFGKNGAEILPFLNDLAEAGKINAKVTAEQVEAADNFGDNLVKLSANGDAWKKTLVMGMAPALSQASDAFLKVFQESGGLKDQIAKLSADGSIQRWTQATVVGLSYLADAVAAVGKAFATFIATMGTGILQATSMLAGLYTGVSKAMTGDFSGAADSMKLGFDKAKKFGEEFKTDMSDMWGGDTIGQKFRAAMASATTAPGPKSIKGDLDFQNVSGVSKKEPSQMPIYEAELAQKIALFEKSAQAEGTLRQYSKAEEAAYWKEVSTRAEVSAEDKARAEKKWRDLEHTLRADSFAVEIADLEQRKQEAQNNYAARIQLAEQAHAKTVAMYGAESKEAAATFGKILEEKRKLVLQVAQLENIASNSRRDKALAEVEFDRQDAELQLSLGLITKQQLLMQQMQFEERMNAIKLQALQESLALVDPQKDPVKKAEIDTQIEQLETQHQLRLAAIKHQVVAAQAGPTVNVFSSMEASFSQAATGIITQAQTLRQALSGIFQQTHAVFVQEMVSKPLAMAAVRVVRESALYKMLAGMQVSSQGAASGAVAGIKAGEASTVVAANAAEASSGAAAAVAPTPFIGPALAMAAAAAMMSFVMGMNGGGGSTTTSTTRIASASRGFDIPSGLNPMTQLHEEEMVLPAHIANPLRDTLAQGPMAPESASGSQPIVIHTSGGEFIHKRDLAKMLTAMKRDFKFS